MLNILSTIALYALIYIVAIFLFHCADISKSKSQALIFIALAIFILALIAGLRDESVGTDTAETIKSYMNTSYVNYSLLDLVTKLLSESALFYYIISRIILFFGLGSRTFLFALELLIIIPVSICAYLERKETPMAATMTFYLLLFYQLGFNWIRQSIAASFLLLAIVFFKNKQYFKALLFAIFSGMFHASAIIGVAFFLLAYCCIKLSNGRLRWSIIVLAVIVAYIIMRYWQPISLFLINRGILSSSYMGYIRVFSGETTVTGWFQAGLRTYGEYILRIAFWVMPIIIYNIIIKRKKASNFDLYAMCVFLSLLVYSAGLLGLHTVYVNRVVYYMDYVNILLFGCCYEKTTHHERGKWVISLPPVSNTLIILLCIIYNIWLYYVLGWHATVPYIFNL